MTEGGTAVCFVRESDKMYLSMCVRMYDFECDCVQMPFYIKSTEDCYYFPSIILFANGEIAFHLP